MKKNKPNKIDRNQTVAKVNVGIFEIRYSVAKVEIEDNKKNWKMVFASGTVPYATLVDMERLKKHDAINALCTGFYGTMSLCVNPNLLTNFLLLLNMEEKNGKNSVEKND